MMHHPALWYRISACALTALMALGLSSCSMGGGTSSGTLTQNLEKTLGDYAVVNLSSGAVTYLASIPDLLTNPIYRTSVMAFKAVPGGSFTQGQAPGTFGAQPDEAPTSVSVSRFYFGVFTVTQGQWTTITGTGGQPYPWTVAAAAAVAGPNGTDPTKPAFALSRDAIYASLETAQSQFPFPVTLPSGAQWEYACRGGSSSVFFWGDLGTSPVATAGTYAVVAETYLGLGGPQTVGSLQPNAFGLYDMLGNIWQWTSDGTGIIRGGSWRDTLSQARCANKLPLDTTTSHALVGVRLVFTP